jgi:lysophospholipase L1-like esterase
MDAIAAERPRGPFELVTLLIGVNDQYRARSLKSFAVEFKPVLNRAVQLAGRASRVVAVSIPDWGSTPFAVGRDTAAISRDIDEYNAHARSVAEERGVAWVDVTILSRNMLTDPSLAVEDGLHPSGELYRRWAELVLPAAIKALAR